MRPAETADPASELPAPLRQLYQRMQQLLRTKLAANQGRLPFDRFMELALFAPELGYYQNGLMKFGRDGDFITAPEISPLFGRCLARQCAEVLERGGDTILEIGAGSGRMAIDLLAELQRLGSLPARYLILELSASLRARQQGAVRRELPELAERVHWLERLPDRPVRGLILANEVLDAMPVHRFRAATGGLAEAFVIESGGRLELSWQPAGSVALAAAVAAIEQRLGRFAEGYASEVNLRLGPWLAAMSGVLEQGVLLLFDYGYSAAEYYHPERSMGTLLCHYRHRAHGDPLHLPGLEDITASVDFSAAASAGEAAGLECLGYTTQSHFLLGLGVDQLLAATGAGGPELDLLQGAKQLILPTAMGERFKVLALGRGMDGARLSGFRLRDFAARL